MTDVLAMYGKYLYPNFSLPESFINYVAVEQKEDIEPWWFFYCAQNYVDFWCKKIKELYPDRKLIPFANLRYSDDIVCFDGEDTTEEQKIYYIHAFASAGWEGRGHVDSFTEWLIIAKCESARYKAEQAEQ